MILKDLLKKNKQVVILTNNNNRKKFLSQAKKECFVWNNGDAIKKNDECFFHTLISNDNTISNVSAMCYVKSKELQSIPVYKY